MVGRPGGGGEGVTQPFVPSRLRVPVLAAIALAVAVVAALGVHYAGDSGPGRIDDAVGGWLGARFGAHFRLARDVTNLAGPSAVAIVIAVLALVMLVRGRLRGAMLAVAGPCLAGACTQFLLKPLVGRTIGGGLAFPSGHTTGAMSIALVVVLLSRSALPRAAWRAVVAVAACYVAVVPAALVVAHYHYATDTIGGACVAFACVVGVALVLDAVGERRHSAPDPAPPGVRELSRP